MEDVLGALLKEAHAVGHALSPARRFLEASGLACETVPGSNALLATRGDPRLCFCGHVDVVPVGAGWDRAPGEVAAGRIFGRGACDMLASVATWIELARSDPARSLAIALTTDEETRMGDAEALVASGRLDRFEALVVGEPTDLEVGVAEKGVLWLRATVQGRAAHGSMPHEGVNAVVAASRAVLRVSDLALPGRSGLLGRPTVNVGRIEGGDAVNVVPASCSFDVDVRYLPGTTREEAFDLVDAALERVIDVHRLDVLGHHPPFEAGSASLLASRAEEAVASAGRTPRRVGLPYGTEASRYAALPGEVVILGPGERALAHTNRESVRLDDLRAGLAAYRALAEAYGTGGKAAE